MTEERKKKIIKELEVARKTALYALIEIENICLNLAEELKNEYPSLSNKLSNLGISTMGKVLADNV